MRLNGIVVVPAILVVAALMAAPAHAAPATEFAYDLVEGQTSAEYALVCTLLTQRGWAGNVEARVAFDVSDDESCHTLRATAQGLTLGRIRGGRFLEMTEPSGTALPKECELQVFRRQDSITVLVDGRVVLRAQPEVDMGGRVGYGIAGLAAVNGLYLQPLAEVNFTDDFTRGLGELGDWEPLVGTWENTTVAAEGFLTDFAANPFAFHAQAQPLALAKCGQWFWDAYSAGISVRPTTAKTVGLCFYVQDDRNYLAFRWHSAAPGEAATREVVEVVNGVEKILASEPGGFAPGHWYRLAIRLTGGKVRAYIDRSLSLMAQSDAFALGAIGLTVGDGEVFFDDLTVCKESQSPDAAVNLPAEFQSDALLSQLGVYTARGMWGPNQGGAMWHWGHFADDVEVDVPLDACGGSRTIVVLRGDGQDPSGAYQVAFTPAGGNVALELLRAGQQVQQTTAPAAADAVLTAGIAGGHIEVHIDGESVLSYDDADPLTGRKVGMIVGSEQPLQVATAESSHALDCTFTNAPTDWITAKGDWGIDVRWPCDRRWAFFGGTGDANPTIWSKQAYVGDDVVVEIFGAIRMDLPHIPGYSHPSDLCITLCGNGSDLGSGYSFVFAGFGNTKSVLFKGGQVVAEAPGVVFETPVNTNLAFQRNWFRLRAEKIGPTLRFLLNGNLIFQYRDPEPLPGGQVALWSYRNGPIFARVRTWFDEAQSASLPKVYGPIPDEPGPFRWAEGSFSDFEANSGEWHTIEGGGTRVFSDPNDAASGSRSLKVVNTVSGGPFAAYANMEPFTSASWPEISFDYLIPEGVKINLYAYVRGSWHEITMTGEPTLDANVKRLGAIPGVVGDGQWHHATLDLQAALTPFYPGKGVRVAHLAFASPDMTYLRCGIGGNPKDSFYRIDNFRLGPPQPAR